MLAASGNANLINEHVPCLPKKFKRCRQSSGLAEAILKSFKPELSEDMRPLPAGPRELRLAAVGSLFAMEEEADLRRGS